jgi:hypothetical protein
VIRYIDHLAAESIAIGDSMFLFQRHISWIDRTVRITATRVATRPSSGVWEQLKPSEKRHELMWVMDEASFPSPPA